jgi:hypothetical protein
VSEAGMIQLIQDVLAYMTKWRMPQIVSQSNSLSKIFVEIQSASYSPGYLGYFQSVSEPGDIMVTQRSDKDLCLMFKATESLGVDDTVTVTLETGPYRAWFFPPEPTTTGFTLGSIRRKRFFSLLCLFTYIGLPNHGITAQLQVKTESLIYRTSSLASLFAFPSGS